MKKKLHKLDILRITLYYLSKFKQKIGFSSFLTTQIFSFNHYITTLLAIALTVSCNGNKVTKDENIIEDNTISKGINVEATVINNISFNQQLVANGIVNTVQKSNLRFKTSEELVSVKVKNGQKVKKGQVLGVLENSILKNQLERNEIDFNKAKNEFINQKINYGFKTTTPDSEIPPSTLKNIQIKSGLFETKNAYENAKILYNQTILRAPFSGVIANLDTKNGNLISTSDIFCTIIEPNNLEVSFHILENEYDLIDLEQEIEISSFSDIEVKYKGKITEINPIVNKNGLIKIRAKIISKDVSLLDGMNVKIFINKPLNDVIVIPKKALVLRSNREVVFTVHNGVAKWNYVEIAGENFNNYAIKKGLRVKDTVIVSGNLNLTHNAKINISFNR